MSLTRAGLAGIGRGRTKRFSWSPLFMIESILKLLDFPTGARGGEAAKAGRLKGEPDEARGDWQVFRIGTWGELVPSLLPALPLESVLSLCFLAGELPFLPTSKLWCKSLFLGEMKLDSRGSIPGDMEWDADMLGKDRLSRPDPGVPLISILIRCMSGMIWLELMMDCGPTSDLIRAGTAVIGIIFWLPGRYEDILGTLPRDPRCSVLILLGPEFLDPPPVCEGNGIVAAVQVSVTGHNSLLTRVTPVVGWVLMRLGPLPTCVLVLIRLGGWAGRGLLSNLVPSQDWIWKMGFLLGKELILDTNDSSLEACLIRSIS